MDMTSIVHELTMKHLENQTGILNRGPADYAEVYLQTFNSIEAYLKRHRFEPIGDAPEWK